MAVVNPVVLLGATVQSETEGSFVFLLGDVICQVAKTQCELSNDKLSVSRWIVQRNLAQWNAEFVPGSGYKEIRTKASQNARDLVLDNIRAIEDALSAIKKLLDEGM